MIECKKTHKIINIIILLAGFVFLIWRAPYGFCFNDEGFYVTLAQRMYQGDALIADEWHGTQNLGPVLLPLYALFRLFFPSNEGIMLFLRYVYCLLWWGTCVIVYKTLAKQYKGAILAFVYLIFLSPADYMNVSYNSVGLMSILLLCCLLFRISPVKDQNIKIKTVVFSILWIVLTLCSPFMAVAYLCGLTLCFCLSKIWRSNEQKLGNLKNLLVIYKYSVGLIALVAALYLYTFVLSRAEISHILDSIPLILSDPEHSSINVWGSIMNVPRYVFSQYPA